MEELFRLDLKNYDEEWQVLSRPSVRAVIMRDGKVMLIHSEKYDYYSLPGGGIEEGETQKEALIREVLEETGHRVIPESISEYGVAYCRRADEIYENQIWEHNNYYYFCDINDESAERKLEEYEKEEGFTVKWVEPFAASRHNRHHCYNGGDKIMIKREARVLEMIDSEIRKRSHIHKMKENIELLGHPEYFEMLDYVKAKLEYADSEELLGKQDIFYSRFEHTRRVLNWAKRLYDLYDNKAAVRFDELMIATIFHDVGRSDVELGLDSHAAAGVPITREFLSSHGYDESKIEYICSLVGAHSDKERMCEADIDPTLLLLMEADLMDDMGALGVVMDCMITEKRNPYATFIDCFDHITRFTLRIQKNNQMVTPAGRKLWEEKTRLVQEFANALENDLM